MIFLSGATKSAAGSTAKENEDHTSQGGNNSGSILGQLYTVNCL